MLTKAFELNDAGGEEPSAGHGANWSPTTEYQFAAVFGLVTRWKKFELLLPPQTLESGSTVNSWQPAKSRSEPVIGSASR